MIRKETMSKYTEEFRRSAIELMKQVGITKACKELKVSHCTIYRWCRELEGSIPEPEEPVVEDLDAILKQQVETLPSSDVPAEEAAEEDASEASYTIATAMAMLVIENTHLREVIKHLRGTISGLSDHILL